MGWTEARLSPRGCRVQEQLVRSHRCALGSLICSDSRMLSPAYTVPSIGVFFLRRVRALAGILLPEEGWSGCCCLLSANLGHSSAAFLQSDIGIQGVRPVCTSGPQWFKGRAVQRAAKPSCQCSRLLPLGLDALIYPNCGRAGQAVAVCSLFAASSHLQVRLGSPEMALLCRVGPEH